MILIVGSNVRNVAESAKKAGYEVFALTRFDDEDLKLYAEVERIAGRELVKKRVEQLAEELSAGVVLTTGFEDLRIKVDVLGTNPREAARVKDKLKFYRTLDKAGIPYPELVTKDEGIEVICKPRMGGGGEGAFLSKNPELKSNLICQRYVRGFPCSVSLIAGREVKPVALNEILVGWKPMNASNFRYSGNVTPFIAKKEVVKVAVETAELFDLSGSIGIDFILADKPYVLELNPRFQGSLDSIEWSCDINLFRLHMLGVEGKDIETPKPRRYAARAILFADRRIEVKKSPAGNPFFADVPSRGVYEKGDPLVSILASDSSRKGVLRKVIERRDMFMRMQ
jgi:hypothetical protein